MSIFDIFGIDGSRFVDPGFCSAEELGLPGPLFESAEQAERYGVRVRKADCDRDDADGGSE